MTSVRTLPKPGDLIEIFRTGYEHWAIYVGNDYVVHLVPAREVAGAGVNRSRSALPDKAIVKKQLLSEVARGDRYRVNNKNDNKYEPLPTKEIVQQAKKMVGKEVPYSVTKENCEHFVNMLRYGVHQSNQVDNGFTTFVITLLFGVTGFLFRMGARILRNYH